MILFGEMFFCDCLYLVVFKFSVSIFKILLVVLYYWIKWFEVWLLKHRFPFSNKLKLKNIILAEGLVLIQKVWNSDPCILKEISFESSHYSWKIILSQKCFCEDAKVKEFWLNGHNSIKLLFMTILIRL